MKEKLKLIAADIDDTLTKGGELPSPRTIATIDELMRKQILFGLASGRPVADIKNKYQLWGSSQQYDFLIGYNGGELWDKKTDTLYRYDLLKAEWLKEIIEFMSQFDCSVQMYVDDKYLSSKATDRAWYSAWKNQREFIVAKDLSEFYQRDSAGIMFRVNVDQIPQIHAKLATLTDKEYYGYNTQPDLVEFSNRSCNKANALLNYCRLYDISIDECLAFGDTTNDKEMIRITHGVCMCNGSADTREVAGSISEKPCNEDGFAEYIERYIL